MKKLSALLTLAAAATLAFAACSSTSSTSTSTSTATSTAADTAASPAASAAAATDQTANAGSPPAADSAATDAIKMAADSVSSDFTEQQDKQLSDDAENTVWLAKVQIPKMPCTVVLLKKSSEKMLPCSMKTAQQADADAMFAQVKSEVTSALPNLTAKDVPASNKYLAQALYMDDKTAVLILEQKKPDGYMVSVSFAKPSFYNS